MDQDKKGDDYDLGREIEKAWLIRGEYGKVMQTRGLAYLIYLWIFIISCVVCFLYWAIGGDNAEPEIFLLFLIGIVLLIVAGVLKLIKIVP